MAKIVISQLTNDTVLKRSNRYAAYVHENEIKDKHACAMYALFSTYACTGCPDSNCKK